MHQRVIYFEIPSDNPERSRKFFSDAFGWEFSPFNNTDYWQAITGDPKYPGINGGVMKRTDTIPNVVNTIRVDDIDTAMKNITKAGGKELVPKIEIPSVGWVAYFTDPDGHTHGIVQLQEVMADGQDELQVERTFKAPRKLVWQHWSVPDLLRKWWGPKDFTSPEAKIDFRVGGKYLFAMRSPEGHDYYSTGTYEEIVPLEKIVLTDSFADKEGNIVPSSYYGMGGSTLDEYHITLLFEEIGQKTKMTLKHFGLPGDIVNLTKHGWEESFDKLDVSLKT